jgi:hypothetical protein
MIRASHICRESYDVRSSYDGRKRVDAYFVEYVCPADDVNPEGAHTWRCRFELPAGSPRLVPVDYPNKKAALAAGGKP